MPVITISGQPGTAAHDIGRLTAQRLGIDYIDQEILVQAASTLGVSMASIVAIDERTSTFGERVATMLRRFLERSAAAGASDPMLGTPGSLDIVLSRTYAEAAADESSEDLSDERYIGVLTGLVKDLAAHDNVVIIGRGSQAILKEHPGVLHTLLVAPLADRIESLAQREGLPTEAATRREHDGQKARVAFHQKFFKFEVDKPSHYHLVLNTARLTPEDVAELIATGVARVTPAQRG